ncbi:transmembrane emp24 domain-containing protein 11-like [Scleropages formosus]|uniref:Transmembrane emp24 domain-containing protein 11-like n=1 Tax=Scleropages formosus TaxID=113540 RepID=A0A0P7V0K0_SCLFO|nr:transmembrane emp24 domain-containing protein 11-like [Scleropages formosus]
MEIIRIVWLVLCCLSVVSGMYFDLGEQEKCIIEEIPQDTLVTGYFLLENWDNREKDNSPRLGLTVTVRDPNHQILMSKRYGSQGKFTFTSHSSGQHFLCMQTHSTKSFDSPCLVVNKEPSNLPPDFQRLHLDVQMGEHTLDPGTIKAENTVKTMEYSLQHLIDRIHYIGKQQDFQREREEAFRQMSEETNGNVLWWAVVQTAILIAVGIWQMKKLKDFFIEKKLV